MENKLKGLLLVLDGLVLPLFEELVKQGKIKKVGTTGAGVVYIKA